MPMPTLRVTGRDKPPPGCWVDDSDPLARDLALCVLFNALILPEDLSMYAQPAATGLTPTELAPPSQSLGRANGLAANFAGGGVEYNFQRKAAGRIATTAATCSAFASFTLAGSTTQGITEIGQRTDSNNTVGIVCSSSVIGWPDSSVAVSIGAVAVGGTYRAAVSQRSATARLTMLNGVVASNTTNLGTGNTIGSTQPFTIGTDYTNATRNTGWDFVGLMDSVFWWYRPLLAQELLRLNERPYSFFAVPQRWVRVKASSGPPPTGNLFRSCPMSGLGSGGPYFRDPLVA